MTKCKCKDKIQLVNAILNGYTERDQELKFMEETYELAKVITDKDDDNSFEHFCEEVFDQLQVCISIAEKKYRKTATDVMKEYTKHILKLEERGYIQREVN